MLFESSLSRAQRNKIEPTLQLWLDRKGTPESLGLAVEPSGRRGRVRISIQLSRPAVTADRDPLSKLGVEFASGETVLFGAVSKTDLANLVRLTAVTFVQPVLTKAPSTKRPL